MSHLRPSLARIASVAALLVAFAGTLQAQRVVTQAERVVSITKGGSALLVNPVPIARFSVGDPGVAEATVVSPTEVLS